MRQPLFKPYAPLDVPKPVAPDLWIVDGPDIRMDIGGGLSAPFPTRMTIVRLPDGRLWLHSPIELTDALAAGLAELGPVAFLVAPNTLHYWWAPDWAARYPDAVLYAVPSLDRRAKRPLPVHRPLADDAAPGWSGVLDQLIVRNAIIEEAVFLHRPSRTLILTDLIENFEPARVSRGWVRILLRLAGAADPDGRSPIDMRLSFLGRRRQLRAAVQRMLSWSPERILLAHGRCYPVDGAAELKRAFRWVL